MATRLKTVKYSFPVLASLTNNTLTNLTQITVYLPETGTKTFHSIYVDISMDDIITATGGSITTKTLGLRLGAAAYTTVSTATPVPNSGENMSLHFGYDFTSHFTTNWTGTSMTCDLQVQVNQNTGTTLGMVNVCATVYVTYEYDDTSTTQVKTVRIPLNAPVTSLPTTKTSHDTIPALDTYLPEASKTYRNIAIITEANSNANAATDHTVTYELSSLGTQVTGNYESALITDRWTRYIWNITSYITTNVTHTFNVWSSLAARHHTMHAYMEVTYEFDASATTSVMNSLMMPMNEPYPAGLAAGNFARHFFEFYIPEPNVSLKKMAAFLFISAINSLSGTNARLGTGSFVAYTNAGSSVTAGNRGLMIRHDAPGGFTFARGKNKINLDLYDNSITGAYCAYLVINYTSDVSADGIGAHNHTVIMPLTFMTNGSSNTISKSTSDAARAITIPETNYFITNVGVLLSLMAMATNAHLSPVINAEIQSSEGGTAFWKTILKGWGINDAETGLITIVGEVKNFFKRWVGDPSVDRYDIEVARDWQSYWITATGQGTGIWVNFFKIVTYHSITHSVAGNIVNSNGGTVTISLHNTVTKEKLLETSRVGNGAYSFTWYDDTQLVFVEAYEDANYKGRSENGYAS